MFDDEFLDDQDLMNEMLLTEDDAWRLYRRDEITREQLFHYLEKRKEVEKNKQKPNTSIAIVFIVIVAAMTCIFISLLLRS
jgi:hypothetical protein